MSTELEREAETVCPRCHGGGTVLVPVGRDRFSGMYDHDEIECVVCRGTGRAS